MSAHALLNLLNGLGKRSDAMLYNKFNNTGARMQDSIYFMTVKSIFISDF